MVASSFPFLFEKCNCVCMCVSSYLFCLGLITPGVYFPQFPSKNKQERRKYYTIFLIMGCALWWRKKKRRTLNRDASHEVRIRGYIFLSVFSYDGKNLVRQHEKKKRGGTERVLNLFSFTHLIFVLTHTRSSFIGQNMCVFVGMFAGEYKY